MARFVLTSGLTNVISLQSRKPESLSTACDCANRGCLARRIVCRLRTHDNIKQGQRIGLIMFGSRVDHSMPLRYQTTLAVGERVQARRSIIRRLGQ